ncbi:MAG TPA: hypothetical protein VJP06_07285 [Thermoplasmata archaeon]|nr:hypothetical protein [Thermoplasmata archaeon]
MVAFLAAVPATAVTAGGAVLADPTLGPYAFIVIAIAVLALTYSLARAIIDRSAALLLSRLILGGVLKELPQVFVAHEILLGYE